MTVATVRQVLVLAAVGEAVTGLALVLVPSMVGRLLFGSALTDAAMTMARVCGIALIGLGLACWPGPPRIGMLAYSAAVALYLVYVGLVNDLTGILLWPAVVVHLVLTVMLASGRVRALAQSSS